MLGRRKRFVAGIEPLDSVLLPGGIFIPHRMAGLPELPPQILIPAGGGVNSTLAVTSGPGVVGTLPPDESDLSDDTFPTVPDFSNRSFNHFNTHFHNLSTAASEPNETLCHSKTRLNPRAGTPTSTPKPGGGGGGGPGNGSKPNPGQDDFPGGNPQQDTGDVSPPAVPLEGDNGDPTKTTARTTTPSVVVGPIRPALPVAMDLSFRRARRSPSIRHVELNMSLMRYQGVVVNNKSNSSIGKALYRPTSPKLKAVPYEGFQYLEPCLLPAGTYIALETLPVVFNETDTYNGNIAGLDLFDIVNEIVQTELSQSVQREIGMGKLLHLSGRQRQQTPPVDLVPDSQSVHLLLSMRLPMGIFIPDTYLTTQAAADGGEEVDDADASYSTPTPAMMVFLFYNTTFPGLKPYETIYVPHGLFVPLSALPVVQA
ncbi:hypothetical protein BV898_06511 [Hypsibius exemplaris]|uniref:Uncharacterized protein n=1 Tax=Hypsibius exemplaris TaxID=2072580 RepID=A0A1W0WWD9_HYPEX|nr:hypothetical protein BV898_06511 [Hypsibius exemplaris]